MSKQNGVIHRLQDWLFGKPLPEQYYPAVDEFGNEVAARQVRRIAEFCLVLLSILTALYFGLANFPDPEWWINVAEPWLKEVMLLK